MKSISELAIGRQWDIVKQGSLHQSFNKSCPTQGRGALLENIPNKIVTTLGIVADVNLLSKAGQDYLEIVVSPSSIPIAYHGVYHYRSGSTKQELKGPALQQFLFRKMGLSWDDVIQERATLDAISPEAIDYFQRNAIRNNRMSESSYTTD